MSSDPHTFPSKNLPDELLLMIFSNLTVVELARAQQTCKRWYSIAQQHSALWINARPFFSYIHKLYFKIKCNRHSKREGEFQKKSLKGFQQLRKNSNNKLDCLEVSRYSVWSKILHSAVFDAIEKHPPTTLFMEGLYMHGTSEYDTRCLELLAKNTALKHLELDLKSRLSPWKFELVCSLESVKLRLPDFRQCSNKESLIKALEKVKKMVLRLPLQRPENLHFLEKIGQNLVELNLEEFGVSNSHADDSQFNKKTEICLPKLRELIVYSDSDILNRPYKLNCPQLQLLTIGDTMDSDQEDSFENMLMATESINHVSFKPGRNCSEARMKQFFSKFCHIKKLSAEICDHFSLQSLVNELPRTVVDVEISLDLDLSNLDRKGGYFLDRIRRIVANGGSTRKAKRGDNLVSIFEGTEIPRNHLIKVFGKAKLRALVFGRGK